MAVILSHHFEDVWCTNMEVQPGPSNESMTSQPPSDTEAPHPPLNLLDVEATEISQDIGLGGKTGNPKAGS